MADSSRVDAYTAPYPGNTLGGRRGFGRRDRKEIDFGRRDLIGVLGRMDDNGWIVKDTDPEDLSHGKIKGIKAILLRTRRESNDDFLKDLTLEEKVLLKRLLGDLQG